MPLLQSLSLSETPGPSVVSRRCLRVRQRQAPGPPRGVGQRPARARSAVAHSKGGDDSRASRRSAHSGPLWRSLCRPPHRSLCGVSDLTGHNVTPTPAMPPVPSASDASAPGSVGLLARMIAEQQHQLLSQAEMIGTLRAELAALRSVDGVRRHRRWRSWLALGLVVVVGSASCQAPPAAKHPELCRAVRGAMGEIPARIQSGGAWTGEAVLRIVEVAEKVC